MRTATENKKHMQHRGKKDLQPNDFSIFLSLFLLHIIHVPFHLHHQLTERIFTLFAYPFFVILQIHKLLHDSGARHVFAHSVCLVYDFQRRWRVAL